MAFSGATVWEVQTGGDDTNHGGGFDTGATFKTDGAATSATTSAPVFTSASYNFVAGDVGAWLYIKSGTNWTPGWYQIASVASNAATLSAAAGAGIDLSGMRPTTVTGCATTGSPTGATWGVDYSQSATARLTFTDLVIDGTTNTKFTSAANPVGANFIGNIISVTSGTGFTVQRVLIQSTATTTATCDKSLGTLGSTGGNGKLGGCLASPGTAGELLVAGNLLHIKAGTYTVTSASTNVAAGCLSHSGAATAVMGYQSTRADFGTAPLLQASGISTFELMRLSGNGAVCANVSFDGASLTASTGLTTNANSRFTGYKLSAVNCTVYGLRGNVGSTFVYCKASGCSGTAAISTGNAYFCEAFSNTTLGIEMAASQGVFSYCLSYSNSGASSDGFGTTAGTQVIFLNCVAYGNGRDGFRTASNGDPNSYVNCIAEANTGIGFSAVGAAALGLVNCGVYSNGTNVTQSASLRSGWRVGLIAGTGSFFTNAAAGDFSLNNTAGAGAELRGTGLPGTYLSGTTTGYLDIGGAQHSSTGSPGEATGEVAYPFVG